MNPDDRNDFSADERENLLDELFELEFGCHPDPDALRARIAADPRVAALWTATRAQSDVLREAATVEVPKLTRPREGLRVLKGMLKRTTWLAAAAALVVGCFAAHWGYRAWQVQHARETNVELVVSGPRGSVDGAGYAFTVEARDAEGGAEPAMVAWIARDADGNELANERQEIRGRQRLEIPAHAARVASLEVRGYDASTGAPLPGTDDLRLELAGIEARPFVHVTTDRPHYEPGDLVRARIVRLDRLTQLPATAADQPALSLRLVDGTGTEVASWPSLRFDDRQQVAAAAADLPEELAGGRYTVEIVDPMEDAVVASTGILVRRMVRPRLDQQIALDQGSYAPGDPGVADVTVRRIGGGPAADAGCEAQLWLDGTLVWSEGARLDAMGRARFRFEVPFDVARGEARFTTRIVDGGTVETGVETFVVPTGELVAHAWPEGGRLVAGFENRVYLEVRDPLERPVDAVGALVDGEGREVARFETDAQGLGRIAFTPEQGSTYRLRIVSPNLHEVELPATADGDDAVLLRSLADRHPAGEPLRVRVACADAGPKLVAAFCRGAMVGQATVRGAGEHEVALDVPAETVGVLRVTVFDATLRPRAERLVARAVDGALRLDVATQNSEVAPGGEQIVTVRAARADGSPVANAALGLNVYDATHATLAGIPRVGLVDALGLLADVAPPDDLEPFVAHAAPEGTDVDRATDLLLGTRGWRTFAWHAETGSDADRLAGLGAPLKGVAVRDGLLAQPQAVDSGAVLASEQAELRRDTRRASRGFEGALGVSVALLLAWILGELWSGAAWLAGMRGAGRLGWALFGTFATVFACATLQPAVFGAAGAPDARAMLGMASGDEVWSLELEDKAEVSDFGQFESAQLFFDSEAAGRLVRFAAVREAVALDEEADELAEPSLSGLLAEEPFGEFSGQPSASMRPMAVEQSFAHSHTDTGSREDFPGTIAWHALLVTDADGVAQMSFDAGEQLTDWTIEVDGHARLGARGGVAQARATFATRLPLSVEATLPTELSAGDRILLPVALAAEGVDELELDVHFTGLAAAPSTRRAPLRDGRGRELIEFTVGDGFEPGAAAPSVTLSATGGGFVDRTTQRFRIVPRGFPHQRSWGGSLSSSEPTRFRVAMPDEARALTATLRAYPSVLAQLRQGLEGLLQEPHGCFEQTSSTTYPNILVLSFLESTGRVEPALASRARELIATGYDRLVGFESPSGGFEWFGSDPAHDALTAYGLMEFTDMQAVQQVDTAMVARTRAWLLERRDGQGGFRRSDAGFHSFGHAPELVVDAWITMALLHSGEDPSDLAPELAARARRAVESSDAYEVALCVNALALAGSDGGALEAALREGRARLAALQADDGSLTGSTRSITASTGGELQVETTALAILAWLPDPEARDAVAKAVGFLQTRRLGNGAFGSTQATIQALRALTGLASRPRSEPEWVAGSPGEAVLEVLVDDEVAVTRPFDPDGVDPIEVELTSLLQRGADHRVELRVRGLAEMPWSAELSYHADRPADDPNAPVALRTELPARATEGDVVPLRIVVGNLTDEPMPMLTATVGLPAGLEVPTEILDALVAAGDVAHWETRGRELVFYWRGLEAQGRHELLLECIARLPGTTTGAASRAWLYYTPTSRRWAPPLRIEVEPLR